MHRIIKTSDGTEDRVQIGISAKRRQENCITGGHLGVMKTARKLRERLHQLNYQTDVNEWCKTFVNCASSNGPQERLQVRICQQNIGYLFEKIAIDVVGPLPEYDCENKYIVVDYFSKCVEAYSLHNQETTTVDDVLDK